MLTNSLSRFRVDLLGDDFMHFHFSEEWSIWMYLKKHRARFPAGPLLEALEMGSQRVV
jgi:hypothetical protein